MVNAQCTLTKLTISSGWPYITDIGLQDDVVNDLEPHDDNDADALKNNGVVAVGTVYTNGITQRQAMVTKLDTNGNMLWQNSSLGGNGNDAGYAIEQASDGNFIVCGTKHPTTGNKKDEVWFFKLDFTTGNIITGSEHTYGGTGDESGYDIKEDVVNNKFVIAGASGKNADGDLNGDNINAQGDYWVVVLNNNPPNYTIYKQATFHGTNTGSTDPKASDLARGLEIDYTGSVPNYIVTGACKSCESNKSNQ